MRTPAGAVPVHGVGDELRPMLLDRHGVTAALHHGAGTGIQKAVLLPVELREQRPGNPERAHRVPDAQEFDRGVDMAIGMVRPYEVLRRVRAGAAVVLPGPDQIAELFALEHAAGRDESGEAARGIGPARKAEQKDLVAGIIVLREEHIGGEDIVGDAVAGHPVEYGLEMQPRRADAAKIEDDLQDAARVLIGMDRPGHQRDIGLGGLRVGVVPCAVAADDNAFHRRLHRTFPYAL